MSKKAIRWNLGAAILVVILFLILTPKAASWLVFEMVLINWLYILLVIVTILFLLLFMSLSEKNMRRSVLGMIMTVLSASIFGLCINSMIDNATYKTVGQFNARSNLVASDADRLRYTALKTAFNDVKNSITVATEEVKSDYTKPLITDQGFSYLAPITPDGVLPTIRDKNPGFVHYDDRPGVQTKVRRIDQPQQTGLDMLWFDDIWYGVFRSDFFATYETPHFLPLDPADPNRFTAVIPKIKYKYWLIPYWGGVTLVHNDGRIEDLSVEVAQADPRLKGKWIAPVDLMRDYVKHQNYQAGFWPNVFKYRAIGKLDIDDVKGRNKFPLFTRGADGRDYFVVATKAAGAGGGLYRMYFATADTFDLTYYEFGANNTVYGPNAALKRVFNLPRYNWHRESEGGGESGNMTAIEPVYIVRPGDESLYWKFSITTKDYTGTSGAAVINASNLDKLRGFENRAEFEAWLHSTDPLDRNGQMAPTGLSPLEQIRWHLNRADELTRELQTQTQ